MLRIIYWLMLIIIIVLGAVISNNLVIGEFLILILFPVAVYLFGYSNVAVALIVFVSLLSTYKLSDNLIRTFKGTEQKLSSVLFKKK